MSVGFRLAAVVSMTGALTGGTTPHASVLARITTHDNLHPAGVMRSDTLVLRLVLQRGEWRPEGDAGLHMDVEAFGERDGAPSVPAPLIRVRTGTVIRAVVSNALPDSTAHIIGLGTHPIAVRDTLHLAPGDSALVTFTAGATGTFLYRAVIGTDLDDRASERETTGGAFVVDPPDASPSDRIFVINIYGRGDSTGFKNALAMNGRSWPYTERFAATVGDSIRWRVLNASARTHPMHLHGFYFTTTAKGDGRSAQAIAPDQQRLEVTDPMPKWSTRDIVWSPDRPGNWLYHCHLTFHVIPGSARLDRSNAAHDDHSGDATKHMAGLVLGIAVAPRGTPLARGRTPRTIDLYFTQGGQRGRMASTYSYIVSRRGKVPSRDSVQLVGSTIVATRGEPTDITVHNIAGEGTSIHWHGVELESWSDGVAGWSGTAESMAPPVAPGKSFTARLTLPRAGTFMYHTHLNDIAQVTGGAVGAIVVLEPGERHDPTRDHVFLAHWGGLAGEKDTLDPLMVNGDSMGRSVRTLRAGVPHRLRFINIGPANTVRFELRRAGDIGTWTSRAKDGADLAPSLRLPRPAQQFVAVGETFDFEITPTPGDYVLSAAFGAQPVAWSQRITFR